MKMLKVDSTEKAKEKMQHRFADFQGKVAEVDLKEASGRILYEDTYAPFDVPEFNRSTVDGYAVLTKDTYGVSESLPVFLEVIDQVEMGKIAKKTLKGGQAIYVPTGGMIPEGSDGVIMIEHIESLDENTIAIYRPVAPGEGMIFRGEDIKKNELLLKKGKRLTSYDIGAVAAMGMNKVRVFQKPKVAIMSTGDEIVPPQENIKMGEIRDINTYSLGALIENLGGQVTERLLLKDRYEVIKDNLESAIKNNDIVLVSGGSSVGLKDMTAQIIDDLGEPGVFINGVAIKPGKPTIVGRIQNTAVFGLPGHPVSAMIVCRIFVGYLLKEMLCMDAIDEIQQEAICNENIHSAPGRETYQMVEFVEKDNKIYAQPIYGKSGAISTLTRSDGFIKIPINKEGVNKGDKVKVIMF